MNTDFFIDLLHEVKEFEHSGACKPGHTIEDFRLWLNDKKYRSESPATLFRNENHAAALTENEICKQVLLLSRYSRQLIRKGLSSIPELANEEFTYLYRLKDEPSLTKIQLIERNGHEKQTGTQILKRLLDYGLIEERHDEADRRSKRLKLTEKGEDMFHRSVEKVDMTSQVLSGSLDTDEKDQLLVLLRKLNEFHAHVYSEHRHSEVSRILELIR